MTTSLAAVPSISEIEDLLKQMRELGEELAEQWREFEVAYEAGDGEGGGGQLWASKPAENLALAGLDDPEHGIGDRLGLRKDLEVMAVYARAAKTQLEYAVMRGRNVIRTEQKRGTVGYSRNTPEQNEAVVNDYERRKRARQRRSGRAVTA